MFCVIKGKESLGIGKLVHSDDDKLRVEYFDSPARPTKEIEVPVRTAVRKLLDKNTRIFLYSESSNAWLVGRVLQDMEDGVEVRFSNKTDIWCKYENLFVRWSNPIDDPTDFLASLITETPRYAETRREFLRSHILQRGNAWGISALLSSVIELEPHQVNVIKKVLNDPSQRYLLADEVGLGKTIEAGVVVRQAVLDDSTHHFIIILTPTSLVSQWREELARRFGLDPYLDISVQVISYYDPPADIGEKLLRATMLVIDEAHHLASKTNPDLEGFYALIANTTTNIERLLLLSATPVLRNESGFLRMLHLLDPVVYSLEDEQSFRIKVKNRQDLAESVALLDPQNAFFLEGVLDNLEGILSEDDRLIELISNLREVLKQTTDEEALELCEAIRVLRAHLSETYRLHRRVLRNRRKTVSYLTPDRGRSSQQVANETQIGRFETLLESWRISASLLSRGDVEDHGFEELKAFYWHMVNKLLSAPGEIASLCKDRLRDLQNKGMEYFPEEKELLSQMATALDIDDWIDDRVDSILQKITELVSDGTKVIVFCSLKEVADSVYQSLFQGIGGCVVRHSSQEDRLDSADADWRTFNANADVKIIVCDHQAEEGINLQGGAKCIVHFDLPLNPNRIEQRMGRVDRYGSGDPVMSIVVQDESSNFQRHWYSVLDEGLGVFAQSISSLQYLIDEKIAQLNTTIFHEGIDAILDLERELGGEDGLVNRELRLIDQQDSLDELSQSLPFEFDDIEDMDSDWRGIKEATMSWAVDTLMFSEVQSRNQDESRLIDPPFRFKYQAPQSTGHATLIPLTDFVGKYLGALDYEHRNSTPQSPLSFEHCSRRQSAVKYGARLIRYGDEFIEALKSFSDTDDRGRSFAIWRQLADGPHDKDLELYFSFDICIESDLSAAREFLFGSSFDQSDAAISALKRRSDSLFAPSFESVWVDEDGEEVELETTKHFLSQPFNWKGQYSGYRDTNLKTVKFLKLKSARPDLFQNWEQRCSRMRSKALLIVSSRSELDSKKNDAIKTSTVDDEIRFAQLKTRINSLHGIEADFESSQLEFESELSEALIKGIEEPTISVDVVGVTILSTSECPVLD